MLSGQSRVKNGQDSWMKDLISQTDEYLELVAQFSSQPFKQVCKRMYKMANPRKSVKEIIAVLVRGNISDLFHFPPRFELFTSEIYRPDDDGHTYIEYHVRVTLGHRTAYIVGKFSPEMGITFFLATPHWSKSQGTQIYWYAKKTLRDLLNELSDEIKAGHLNDYTIPSDYPSSY